MRRRCCRSNDCGGVVGTLVFGVRVALLVQAKLKHQTSLKHNFVVTTPIKSCSSSPMDPTEMRRRCESGASDMSVWSTDSRDGVDTPMSCATPRNASQSFMSSNMDSISTPRTILRSNQQRRHGVSTPSLRAHQQ